MEAVSTDSGIGPDGGETAWDPTRASSIKSLGWPSLQLAACSNRFAADGENGEKRVEERRKQREKTDDDWWDGGLR